MSQSSQELFVWLRSRHQENGVIVAENVSPESVSRTWPWVVTISGPGKGPRTPSDRESEVDRVQSLRIYVGLPRQRNTENLNVYWSTQGKRREFTYNHQKHDELTSNRGTLL